MNKQNSELPPSKELLAEAAKFIEGFAASGEAGFVRQRKALDWMMMYRSYSMRPADEPPTVLQCTGGCCGKICGSFVEQDDGERRVDYFCATCGHTRECHEPVSTPAPPYSGLRALLRKYICDCRNEKNDDPEKHGVHCRYYIEMRAAVTKQSEQSPPTAPETQQVRDWFAAYCGDLPDSAYHALANIIGDPDAKRAWAARRATSTKPVCRCGHPFAPNHQTPGTECSVEGCPCGRYSAVGEGESQ